MKRLLLYSVAPPWPPRKWNVAAGPGGCSARGGGQTTSGGVCEYWQFATCDLTFAISKVGWWPIKMIDIIDEGATGTFILAKRAMSPQIGCHALLPPAGTAEAAFVTRPSWETLSPFCPQHGRHATPCTPCHRRRGPLQSCRRRGEPHGRSAATSVTDQGLAGNVPHGQVP